MTPLTPEPVTDQWPNCRRVVVLGASNVTLALPLIIDLIRSGFAGPLQLDIGDSHGRSYGQWTTIPFRSVPGHLESEIWAPENPASGPVHAIVTDVGNDLVYDNSVDQTTEWVQQCVESLREQRSEIVMTGLPLSSIEALGPWRYRLFKTMFFPGCRLSLDEIRSRAIDLNDRVAAIATAADAQLLEQPSSWFGFDPIHVARRQREIAWRQILGGLTDWRPATKFAPSPLRQKLRYWLAKPQRFRRFGKVRESHRCYGDESTRIRFF